MAKMNMQKSAYQKKLHSNCSNQNTLLPTSKCKAICLEIPQPLGHTYVLRDSLSSHFCLVTLPKHQIFIIKLIQHVDTQATKLDPVAPSNYSATLPENEHDWLENPPFPTGNTSTHMVMFFHNLFHGHVSSWGYITLGI